MKHFSRPGRFALLLALSLAAALAATVAVGSATSSSAQGGDLTIRLFMPLVMRNQPPIFPSPAPPTRTPTAVTLPTDTPSPIPFPSDTPRPTMTATASPTVPPTPTTDTGWLGYVAYYRALAAEPPVTENTVWSHGDELHAKYVARLGAAVHPESRSNSNYTVEGNEAGINGNVFYAGVTAGHEEYYGNYHMAIDAWMTGPFHMIAIIDPKLAVSGFGEYAEDIQGMHHYGATLDVRRGRGEVPPGVRFPVYYPRPGSENPNLAFGGFESPDPLKACPGYTAPTGAPVALQLGTGDTVPKVKKTSFRLGDTELAHCWFDETKYKTDPGQSGLAMRNAIIIMPRAPLDPGQEYTVSIDTNGQVYTWSFTTKKGAFHLTTGFMGLPPLLPVP
jgi:hypothetical protein